MIDIIIVTYNAKNKLKGCLKSVEKYTRGIKYLLTIVNNNSIDGTFQFLRNYKQRNINIIHTDKNLGFSGGANIALENTSAEFVVLLDDDAEVTEGWLDKLYKHIKNRPKIGIVGCKIVFPSNRIFCADYRVRLLQCIGYCEIDKGQRNYIKECDALIGPCWLMRRELVKKVGYFDERFFPSQYEDIDYCLRTRLAGYKIIYNGKVKITHYHLFRNGKQFKKNIEKFLKKWKNILHKFPLKDSHSADKHIACGAAYLKKKKFQQALTEFKKAELIDKRFSVPLCKGIALKGLKKFDEAIIEFKKTLSLNPSSFLAHYYLASAYKEMGNIKESRRKYINSIKYLSEIPIICNTKKFIRIIS